MHVFCNMLGNFETNYYHIHSNECPGRRSIILGECLFDSIFFARIDPEMDDLGCFRLIPSHIKLGM